ncbi:Coiled-coil domain-containing protein [Aphelenchoides bicaudatus]|nr:Coiled-coil domain-containing protein [Aphelenchoides bicaudatus]
MTEGFGKRSFNPSNAGSLIDLKAELLTKKQSAKKQAGGLGGAEISKASVLTLTKQEKSANAEKAQCRQDRIKKHEELIRKEESEHDQQRKTMEEKARIYERMTKGEEIVYGDGSKAEFLVNFDVKHRRRYSSDSEDERSDEDRKERDRSPTPPLIQHYDPSGEKTRTFGPSHVPLPADEDERQKKIKELKEMSEKTDKTRQKRKKHLDAKKRADREKVKKFRARLNLSPLPSTSEEESEAEVDQEDSAGPSTEAPMEPAEKRLRYGIREWDNEKFGYNMWLQKQRDKRDDDFRPSY